LVGLRDFQDEKCDVIWKYYPEEAKTLKAMGEIPENTAIDDKKKEPEEGDVWILINIKILIFIIGWWIDRKIWRRL